MTTGNNTYKLESLHTGGKYTMHPLEDGLNKGQGQGPRGHFLFIHSDTSAI